MRINTNISAINAHRLSSVSNHEITRTIEKLSSGLRINRAGDDAAGLSISEKMRGQIRGLSQASRNGQDAISLIQTMEGAASETHSILQRMRELSVQASSDTNTNEDRQNLNLEVSALKTEIDRIANTTEFNTIKALNYASDDPLQVAINSINGKVAGWINDAMEAINTRFGIAHPDSPVQRSLLVEYVNLPAQGYAAAMGTVDGSSLILRINMDKTAPSGVLLSDDALDGLITHEIMHAYEYTEMSSLLAGGLSANETWFMEGLSMLAQGGNGFITAGGSIGTPQAANIAGAFSGSTADYASAYVALKTLHEITVGGINAIIDRMELGDTLDQAISNTTQQNQGEVGAGASNYNTWAAFIADLNANNFDAYLTASTDFTAGTGAIVTGAVAGSSSNLSLADTIVNGTGTALTYTHFTITTDTSGVPVTASTTPEKFIFHIGSNSGQFIEMTNRNLTSLGLGVASIDLTTRGTASSAIASIDNAITSVSQVRSYFGALQNRLEHTIRNLDTSKENLVAAESRIRDADMAKEIMNLTKNNIIQQASQAMLTQANQTHRDVLQLLR